MFCRNCGTQLKDDAKFCEKCGVLVESQSAAPLSFSEVAPSQTNEESGFMSFIHKTIDCVKSGKIVEEIKNNWNKPLKLRGTLIISGFLFILQFIFIFFPAASYEITSTFSSQNQIESIALGDAMQNEFWLFLVWVSTIVSAVMCFTTKKNMPLKKGKKGFLIFTAIVNILFIILGMIISADLVQSQVTAFEDKWGSGFIEYTFDYTFWCYLAILVALYQLVALVIVAIKSKKYYQALENSVEAKLLKFKKMYDEGLLTKEEFDTKTKELLNVQE